MPGAGESGPERPAGSEGAPKATANRPVLITDAPVNLDDEWTRRRNRYVFMMTLRGICVLGAATTYTLSGWLAAAFVVGGLVLPWTAVVMANDRPPKEGVRFRRFFGGHDNAAVKLDKASARQIESAPVSKFDPEDPTDGGDHPVIDL